MTSYLILPPFAHLVNTSRLVQKNVQQRSAAPPSGHGMPWPYANRFPR
jgi:hypothetical protein